MFFIELDGCGVRMGDLRVPSESHLQVMRMFWNVFRHIELYPCRLDVTSPVML